MPDRRSRSRFARRLAVFGPAAIVVITGLLSYLSLDRVRSTRQWVQHTHDVLDASSVVLTALLDMETATRGFILTHDSTFLGPARDAPNRAQRAIDSLRTLTLDNPSQTRRIDTLESAVKTRLVTLDSAADVERSGKTDLSASSVRTSRGPSQMAVVRQMIGEMRTDEDSLLVRRRRDEVQSLEITAAVIILGALMAAILAFFVNRNFDVALRDRRLALEELRGANDRLQEGAIELEFQAEAAQNAAAEAEMASEHASEARMAAEESERRAERLQVATEVLTSALERDEVAALIVDQAMQAVAATSGALATVEENGTEICFRAVRNITVVKVGATLPISHRLPVCAAVRERRPIILETAADIAKLYPEAVQQHEVDEVRSVAAFPLMLDDHVTGVLLVRFDHEQALDASDRALMTAMSRIAAETFDRVRLFEAERDARYAAESANRAKAAFLASMSHELRTPLQAALGFAQLIRSGVYGDVNEQQSEVLGRVERSQTHLSGLIDDILDFARLEAGRVRIESKPVVVAEVIADLAPLVEPQAVKKNVELSLLPPVTGLVVMADRKRLQQILVNLVGNAIKFTPENGTIRVGAQKDTTMVHVFIQDTGKGIPEDRLQAIFEPFVQVEDSLTRTAAGAGLGLAISRDLARAMGGDLKVESELGKGSTFTVLLPMPGAPAST
ncbi:MAG TPA: CHASE3 domain-containing protein [Gemmatimonadaceae bacterium]|jgi:signal transduction histidine kinase/CHASE3 domain sensor protein